MRLMLAIWASKLLVLVGKIMGKKSSSTPGRIALKICPDLITRLSKQVKKDIIAVCGTNGKTTTNNIICSVLESTGAKVVCNRIGANMTDGVATAFTENANIFGKLNADYACLEIDELFTVKVFDLLTPNYIVLTNLFRDQLDRYGDIDITVEALKKAVAKAPDAALILNGDDPIVTSFGLETGKKCIFFGVNDKVNVSVKENVEGRFCRLCGSELKYNFYHYSHLGNYYCSGCNFKRPQITYTAQNVNLDNGISFDIEDTKISVNYKGFYNIYNILAAFAVFENTGFDKNNFVKALENYKPQIGRMEKFDIGVEAYLNLAKNPAGFNQAISTVLADTRKKNIIFAVNDMPSDGEDISWLWDVDFESLKASNIGSIAVGGRRRDDLAVRFKYADFKNVTSFDDMKSAIEFSKNNCEVLYVLVNYTVLFSTQDILRGLCK